MNGLIPSEAVAEAERMVSARRRREIRFQLAACAIEVVVIAIAAVRLGYHGRRLMDAL